MNEVADRQSWMAGFFATSVSALCMSIIALRAGEAQPAYHWLALISICFFAVLRYERHLR